MTIKIQKLIGLTTASFKVQIGGRVLLIPASQVKAYQGNELTFHNKKDAMHIYSMI